MRIKVLHLLSFMLIFSACNGQQPKKVETENTKAVSYTHLTLPTIA